MTNLVARVAYRRVGTPAAANLRVGFHNEDHCSADGGILLCGNIAQSSGQFDVVLFLGVFYHLRGPIAGFANIGWLLVLERIISFFWLRWRNFAAS